MLSATLRYLAAGDSMKSVSYNYRLGMSTVSTIIHDTRVAIVNALRAETFQPFSEDMWLRISEEYKSTWNIPNCIGSIDGKHVRIQAPPLTGSDYLNYKDYFSTVLLAVCDANYCFIAVDIGARGRRGDGGIFHESQFGKLLYGNKLHLPLPRKITSNANSPCPFFLVGDAAFPLGINLMCPFPGRFLEQHKRIFNYRLSRARRVIENAFGILVSKWRIYKRPIIAKISTIHKIIEATVCLHNFLRKRDANKAANEQYSPSTYVDRETGNEVIIEGEWRTVSNENLESVPRMGGNTYARKALDIQEQLIHYFIHESPIEPQWSK